MKKDGILIAGLMFLGIITCHSQEVVKLTDYVDPFIGTGGHGHTFPGATYPFGMIQVSPDTRLEGWDGCSAYHASDDTIYGFSHTHLSGTGCSDYGDILLMPVVGDIKLADYAYASPFNPSSEKASPGYYKVGLAKYAIGVELTASKRAGFHRYTFPAKTKPAVVLDLTHRDKVIASGLKVVGDDEVEGYRFSTAWAKEQRVYFVIKFSKPFKSIRIESSGETITEGNTATGEDIKAMFRFAPTSEAEQIMVKIGISAVSTEGARINLESEIPEWSFEKIFQEIRSAWEIELQKISLSGGTNDQKKVFYTALYHAMVSPNLYMDVDGQYLGRDLKVHQAAGFDYYTVFSLWDTYRALHPLLAIIDQKRTNDFINTFIRQYEEGGLLPVWELSANETNCMIGYHAVPVIADAFLKGIRDYDTEKAFKAMMNSANQNHFGLQYYKTQGFIPGDQEGESVSKTLEYAYDDWCIAQMANEMSKETEYKEFIKRAQYYKNIFDPSTGFMRAKLNNQWFSPFDPYEVNFNYTEANAWQYSFYVPQDISGLIDLMGGKEQFSKRLDELFEAGTQTTGRDQADITGLIGQYAHGNEPSHHMAYLYDFVGQPWKTQEIVHRIMQEFYRNERDGLCGNEDCGQMSAWYVFSAMGFYPVTPGSDYYAIGTPMFPISKINLENGKTFAIKAHNFNEQNYYIQSCKLNGKSHESPFIRHEEIMAGGELIFVMGKEPNYNWGTILNYELRITNDELIQPVPFIEEGQSTFFDSTTITLSSPDPEARIFFKTMSHKAKGIREESLIQDPASRIQDLYTAPFTIHESTTVQAFAQREDGEPSFIIESVFQKIPKNRKIKLNTLYASQYSAGGDIALIDFKKGGENFKTGLWQGYEGVDLDAVVDLGKPQEVHKISVGFLQDVGSWIFFPSEVEFYTSLDGVTFSPAGISIHEFSQKNYEPKTLEQWSDLEPPVQARYVKVVAKTPGICPEWHPGAGHPCWIFADEITVN
ncbi:MAG: glycoside hydrolase family 92 protein [Bacteroidia bacterium]|nr:glycoside hydrolase family 92 protein [Bacteroidia bacterium]